MQLWALLSDHSLVSISFLPPSPKVLSIWNLLHLTIELLVLIVVTKQGIPADKSVAMAMANKGTINFFLKFSCFLHFWSFVFYETCLFISVSMYGSILLCKIRSNILLGWQISTTVQILQLWHFTFSCIASLGIYNFYSLIYVY